MKLLQELPHGSEKRNRFYLLTGLALLVWIYVMVRAACVAFTWDEAFSFMMTVQYNHIIPDHFDVMAANNHYLNSLFMWLSWKVFGSGELALRVPAVLFSAVYLFYVVRFLMQLRSRMVALLGFALLGLSPFLLDFLSLARGYGMAMSLMMIALWHLYLYINRGMQAKQLYIGLLWAGLTLTANLSWLYFFLSYAGVAFLLIASQPGTLLLAGRIKALVIITLLASAFALPAFWLGMQYEKAEALQYGTWDGLWNGSFSSLLERFFYGRGYQDLFWMSMRMFVRVVIGLALFAVLRHGLRVGWRNWNKSMVTVIMLQFAIFIVLVYAQHALLGTKFIMGRTALSLQVLFSVMLILTFDRLPFNGFSKFVTAVPALFFTLHMLCCINIHRTYDWQAGADVNLALQTMEQEMWKKSPVRDGSIRIGVDIEFLTPIQYRQDRHKLPWLGELRFEPEINGKDLLFTVISERNYFRMKGHPEWVMIANYEDDGAALFMNTACKP